MDNLNNMELHKAIKQMRLCRNMTQAKLVNEIGISTFTLIRWERGERLPDGGFIQKLAKALNYTIILNTDGLWSCYPGDELLSADDGSPASSALNVDEIYRRAAEAKDNSVWKSFFSRLVKDNARLESWFRETNGGEDVEENTFRVMSNVILAMVRPER